MYVVLTDRNGSPETNKSKVDYNVYCQSSGSGSISANHDLYFALNGSVIRNENVYVNVKSPNALIQIASGTLEEVEHDSNGSKSIPFSASIRATGGYGVSASLNGNFELITIPRAGSINNFYGDDIEEYFSVKYTSYYSGFTYKLRISIPNVKVLETFNYSSEATFKLSSDTINYLYNYMKNMNTIKIGAVIETWNGNTKIGESVELVNTCSITDCKPILENASYLDSNTEITKITGNNQQIVRNHSTLVINLTNLKSFKGATLNKCTATINGITKSFSNITGTLINNISLNFGTVDVSKDSKVTIVLTDSRGNTDEKELNLIVVNYIDLSINATIKRTQPTTGEIDIIFSGNYYNGSLGNTKNELSIAWKYKEYGTSDWIDGGNITPIINNNIYSNGNNAISLGTIFDYQKSYDFMLVVTDKLITLKPTSVVPQGISIFNWGKDFFNVNGRLTIYDVPITGITLYEDKTGIDTGSFTIDENNCQTLKFYAGDFLIGECKANSTIVHLNYINQGTQNLYVFACRLMKDGNTFTFYSNKRNLISTVGFSQDETDIIKITKIVGY